MVMRSDASTMLTGSSATIRSGLAMSARATEMRCSSPPEKARMPLPATLLVAQPDVGQRLFDGGRGSPRVAASPRLIAVRRRYSSSGSCRLKASNGFWKIGCTSRRSVRLSTVRSPGATILWPATEISPESARHQAQHDAGQRGLAAARFADDRQDLAVLGTQRQRHAGQRGMGVAAEQAALAIDLAQVAHLEDRSRCHQETVSSRRMQAAVRSAAAV